MGVYHEMQYGYSLVEVNGFTVTLAYYHRTGANTYVSYNVKRSTTSGGPYATVKSGVAATSYTDNKLVTGTTYYYVVTAVNAAGQSGPSPQASSTAR